MSKEVITPADRLVGGFVGAAGIGLTALLLPIAGMFIIQGDPLAVWSHFGRVATWSAPAVASAALVGAVVGSKRAVDLLSHLWFTAKPLRLAWSILLWAGLLIAWFCGRLLLGATGAA